MPVPPDYMIYGPTEEDMSTLSKADIDYDDERFNQGVNHVVDLLAKVIDAPDTWVAGDGSEDYDEDLSQTLLNILAARGIYDPNYGRFATTKMRKALYELVHVSFPPVGEDVADLAKAHDLATREAIAILED